MKYKIERLLSKPRAEVWKFFVNQERIKPWQPSLVNIELLHGVAGQPGTESKLTYKESEREFSLTEQVLRCEEPTHFESRFENKFASNTVNNVFIEQSTGETLWIVETTYKFKTLLMKIIGPLFKKNYLARTQKEMGRFKEVLEGA